MTGKRVETVRYTRTAIWLHWAIALLIVLQIAGGFWMGGALEAAEIAAATAPDAAAREAAQGQLAFVFGAYQWHKTFGLLVLILTVARVAWRLMNPPPAPLPMRPLERIASTAVHFGFYVLMIAVPLTGWLMVSASPLDVDTRLFQLLPWPHLPGFAGMAETAKAEWAYFFYEAHEILAFATIGLLVLHVAGALKHQWADKQPELARIGLGGGAAAPTEPGRGAVTAFGLAGALLAAGLVWGAAARGLDGGGSAALAPATGGGWAVDHAASRVSFETDYFGAPTQAAFENWTAEITFDFERPEAGRVVAEFDAAAIETDNQDFKGNVVSADGFDVRNHPIARFETTAIRSLGGDAYEADAVITINDVSVEATLPFTLTRTETGRAIAHGQLVLDRLAFGLGAQNDPIAAYMARNVLVRVHLEADPQ